MGKKSPKQLAFTLLELLVVIAIFAVVSGSAKLRQPPPPPPPEQKQTMDAWAAQAFVELRPGVDLRKIVEQMPFKSAVSLNNEEQEALTNAVVNFIGAYQTGTFESMAKFRIPVESYHFISSITNAMIKHYKISSRTIQQEPMLAFQTWWSTTHSDKYYSNYWIGISPSNCEIRVETFTSITNSLMTVLHEENVPNVGFVSCDPSIILEPTLQQVLHDNMNVKLATIRVLPKPKDNDVVFPVYVRMYWSPKDKRWLPEGLVIAFSRFERKITPFF